MMNTKDWEIENTVERVKELVDSIESFNVPPNQEIIDKINAIGCTSFLCEFKDSKIYMIGSGDKPVKFVVEEDGDKNDRSRD